MTVCSNGSCGRWLGENLIQKCGTQKQHVVCANYSDGDRFDHDDIRDDDDDYDDDTMMILFGEKWQREGIDTGLIHCHVTPLFDCIHCSNEHGYSFCLEPSFLFPEHTFILQCTCTHVWKKLWTRTLKAHELWLQRRFRKLSWSAGEWTAFTTPKTTRRME